MLFTKIQPCKPLQAYLDYFWFMDSEIDLPIQKDTLFPIGSLEVVFNLGQATLTSWLDSQPVICPRIELLGQITGPYPIQAVGHSCLLGIRFHPYTAGLFLKHTPAQFTNSMADMFLIFRDQLDSLYNRLHEARSLPERIHHVEAFLLNRVDQHHETANRFKLVRFIVEQLLIRPHDTNVEKLAAYAGVSARYLQTLFLEFVGLPPKQFLRIIRLQKSFTCLQQQTESLTAIAYTCGYADQSHFIRDFKAFTGLTPSRYVPQAFPLNGLFTSEAV